MPPKSVTPPYSTRCIQTSKSGALGVDIAYTQARAGHWERQSKSPRLVPAVFSQSVTCARLNLCCLKQTEEGDKGIPDEQDPDLAGISGTPPALGGLGHSCSLHATLLVLDLAPKRLLLYTAIPISIFVTIHIDVMNDSEQTNARMYATLTKLCHGSKEPSVCDRAQVVTQLG